MGKSDLESNGGIISRFDVGELVTDVCSGILMIFLFGPFFYALKYAFIGATYKEFLVSIFPGFFSLFKDLSLATVAPWLILGVALTLGVVSRAVFIMHNILPAKVLVKLAARIAHWQLRKWHGLASEWNYKKIVEQLVDRNPFFMVGNTTYAKYRASLDDSSSPLNKSKRYWDHEAFLFLRTSHFYGMFFTFSIAYFLYGLIVGTLKGFHFPEFCLWIGIVGLSFLISVCLFEEVIIHGIAFIQVDHVLYEEFLHGPGNEAQPIS